MTERYSKTELLNFAYAHLAHNYNPFSVIAESADGTYFLDTEGNSYLDMLSCYSALNLGHANQRITQALLDQITTGLTNISRAVLSTELILFTKELAEFCGMEMVLPMNTGAEAVETAIKLARKWGYTRKKIPHRKAKIIVCEGNFHGRTTTIISFSSESQYRAGFEPHTPGFKMIPFGDTESLRRAITPRTTAFLVEPIQGEGGIIVPPDGYLAECARICKERNVLLIADEIQTGLGRTGRIFACDHEGVKPDLLILGKALGGGALPISAVVGSRDLLSAFQPGDHGSTFGGNPLACRVARETLKVLKEEKLAERAAELGEYFINRLRKVKSPHVKEVRGKGLLIGIELKHEAPCAREFCLRLLERGILCKDAHERVIRFAPPLTIIQEQLDWALERIEQVLTE